MDNETQKIISRDDARAQGLQWFYLKPCLHGHACGRSVANGRCRECSNDYNRKTFSTQEGRDKASASYRKSVSTKEGRDKRNASNRRSSRKRRSTQEGRDKINSVSRRSKHKHRSTISGIASQLLGGARRRAKEKRLPCNLDKEWIEKRIEAGFCEATGLKFSLEPGGVLGTKNPTRPSVDRIYPFLGYTKNNCKIVLVAWNTFKLEMPEELAKHLLHMISDSLRAKKAQRDSMLIPGVDLFAPTPVFETE